MSERLTTADRRRLLALARATLEEYLHTGRRPALDDLPPALRAPGAAFVSLHGQADGELRGCIGTFVVEDPLAATVQEMAIAAATRDPRFRPLTASELDGVELEISVLSPPRPARPEEVVVGRHGLRIARGWSRGVLLPQVPLEYDWDRETFLAHTCRKAGLPADAWRRPDTTVEVFTAEVFGERELALALPMPPGDAAPAAAAAGEPAPSPKRG
jgi:AmmeMemoRadiSam system protein A